MARNDPHFRLRIPPVLKVVIEENAKLHDRSINAEIVAQLANAVAQPMGSPLLRGINAELALLVSRFETIERRSMAIIELTRKVIEQLPSADDRKDFTTVLDAFSSTYLV